jgi:hypothetical protein
MLLNGMLLNGYSQVGCAHFMNVKMRPPARGIERVRVHVRARVRMRMCVGRNLDWSIPKALRSLMADVDYTRGGKIVFTASQPVGFIGILHGVRHGGWTYSQDARGKGGKVIANLLQASEQMLVVRGQCWLWLVGSMF